jgi:hypothetical protein
MSASSPTADIDLALGYAGEAISEAPTEVKYLNKVGV